MWPAGPLDMCPEVMLSSGAGYRTKSSRSRRAQSVERADDARPIASRRKRMRERRLGTPAGTVPRRDDTRPDTIGEVVDGRLDPRLHPLACQMIAAEDDVDRLAPEHAQRAERCVDDACVRARREHTDAAAAHARREESLVEDQGIRHRVPVAHRVVPDEPRLVRRHALDLAADEEEAREYVRLGALRDAPTGALDRLERRLRVQ